MKDYFVVKLWDWNGNTISTYPAIQSLAEAYLRRALKPRKNRTGFKSGTLIPWSRA